MASLPYVMHNPCNNYYYIAEVLVFILECGWLGLVLDNTLWPLPFQLCAAALLRAAINRQLVPEAPFVVDDTLLRVKDFMMPKSAFTQCTYYIVTHTHAHTHTHTVACSVWCRWE